MADSTRELIERIERLRIEAQEIRIALGTTLQRHNYVRTAETHLANAINALGSAQTWAEASLQP